MSNITTYIFQFDENSDVIRIPFAKWQRIREGAECVKVFANKTVHIAYAYILLENRKPDYCPRIEGAIYSFNENGRVIDKGPYYVDLLQDLEEETGGVISLHHRKKRKEAREMHCWELAPSQIQQVIDCIWK